MAWEQCEGGKIEWLHHGRSGTGGRVVAAEVSQLHLRSSEEVRGQFLTCWGAEVMRRERDKLFVGGSVNKISDVVCRDAHWWPSGISPLWLLRKMCHGCSRHSWGSWKVSITFPMLSLRVRFPALFGETCSRAAQ